MEEVVRLIFQQATGPQVGDCLFSKAAVASSQSTRPTQPRSRWPRLWDGHSSRRRSLPTRVQQTPEDDAWLWKSYRSKKRRRALSLPTRDYQPLTASTNLNAESVLSGIPRIVSQS